MSVMDLDANELQGKRAEQAKLDKAVGTAKKLVWAKMSESGAPGLAIGVSVDGKTVFRHGERVFNLTFLWLFQFQIRF